MGRRNIEKSRNRRDGGILIQKNNYRLAQWFVCCRDPKVRRRRLVSSNLSARHLHLEKQHNSS